MGGGLQAIDEVNKKEYALKMVRIPRGRSGQIANEEASVCLCVYFKEKL